MELKPNHDGNRSPDLLKRPDVAIVGEINPDIILEGLPRELAEDREMLASGCTLTLGGSSSILAHNLALLGTTVTFSAGWATTILPTCACANWSPPASM